MDINERKQFADILYKTVIPSTLSLQECNERYSLMTNYISTFFPQTLFRFLRCDEKRIDSFYKNQIWVANLEKMNDGYDGRLFFNRSEVENDLQNSLSDKALQSFISNNQSNNSPLNSIVANIDEQKLKMIRSKRDEILDKARNNIGLLFSTIQKSIKITCLSEDISSPAMWGLYSNDESGFSLAYIFNQAAWNNSLSNGALETFNLFPTLYSDTRFSVPNEYIQFLLKYSVFASYFPPNIVNNIIHCPDQTMVTKVALQKSTEWAYEKEWRIIYTNSDVATQLKANAPFSASPVAIYLGRRISYLNERLLKDIAAEKGIPVYKMSLDDNSPTYRLIPKQIQ